MNEIGIEGKVSKSSSSSIAEENEFIDEDDKINVEKIEESSIGNEKSENFTNIESFEKVPERKIDRLDFSSDFKQNLKINAKKNHSETDSHKVHEGYEDSENFESSKKNSDDYKKASKKSSIASKHSEKSSPKSKHSSNKPESISQKSETLSDKPKDPQNPKTPEKPSENFEKSSKPSEKSSHHSNSIKSEKSSQKSLKSIKSKSKTSSKPLSKSNSELSEHIPGADAASFPAPSKKVKSDHSSSEPEPVSDHQILSQKKSESKNSLAKISSPESIKSKKASSKSSSKKIDSTQRKKSSSSSSSSSKSKVEISPKAVNEENSDFKAEKPKTKKFSLSSMALGQGLAQRVLNPSFSHSVQKSESNADDSHVEPGRLGHVADEDPEKFSDALEVSGAEHVQAVSPLMKAFVSQSISSNLDKSIEDSFF